ncbi:MAG: hypothetical protein EXR01_00550 [Acetobacteraceae bacterium]|nr:hypothetical protein [Acetobacteraceae bacterium]
MQYRQVEPNTKLPFTDQSFASATSNAVLKHLGSVDNQQRFMAKMLRIAWSVFTSVPYQFSR